MKIAVWKTGHEIADTVAEAVVEGLSTKFFLSLCHTSLFDRFDCVDLEDFDIHIGYGILRNMDKVFNAATKLGKPWFNIDRGYWKPGHYDGYYRISLNGTQQTTGLDKLQPDYERWEKLGLEILPQRPKQDGYLLCCTATKPVCEFFGDNLQSLAYAGDHILIREKGTNRPLQTEFDGCREVRTFNSSVGWEALRQGIPVVNDSTHSILGAYQKSIDNMVNLEIESRKRFFALQAALQLNLEEIKAGYIWPLITRLLDATLVGTQEKP